MWLISFSLLGGEGYAINRCVRVSRGDLNTYLTSRGAYAYVHVYVYASVYV